MKCRSCRRNRGYPRAVAVSPCVNGGPSQTVVHLCKVCFQDKKKLEKVLAC